MSEDESNSEDLVPYAVQIFLWRQSTPFVRPKFGKVHDAACMVRFKHAILNFFVNIISFDVPATPNINIRYLRFVMDTLY